MSMQDTKSRYCGCDICELASRCIMIHTPFAKWGWKVCPHCPSVVWAELPYAVTAAVRTITYPSHNLRQTASATSNNVSKAKTVLVSCHLPPRLLCLPASRYFFSAGQHASILAKANAALALNSTIDCQFGE